MLNEHAPDPEGFLISICPFPYALTINAVKGGRETSRLAPGMPQIDPR